MSHPGGTTECDMMNDEDDQPLSALTIPQNASTASIPLTDSNQSSHSKDNNNDMITDDGGSDDGDDDGDDDNGDDDDNATTTTTTRRSARTTTPRKTSPKATKSDLYDVIPTTIINKYKLFQEQLDLLLTAGPHAYASDDLGKDVFANDQLKKDALNYQQWKHIDGKAGWERENGRAAKKLEVDKMPLFHLTKPAYTSLQRGKFITRFVDFFWSSPPGVNAMSPYFRLSYKTIRGLADFRQANIDPTAPFPKEWYWLIQRLAQDSIATCDEMVHFLYQLLYCCPLPKLYALWRDIMMNNANEDCYAEYCSETVQQMLTEKDFVTEDELRRHLADEKNKAAAQEQQTGDGEENDEDNEDGMKSTTTAVIPVKPEDIELLEDLGEYFDEYFYIMRDKLGLLCGLTQAELDAYDDEGYQVEDFQPDTAKGDKRIIQLNKTKDSIHTQLKEALVGCCDRKVYSNLYIAASIRPKPTTPKKKDNKSGEKFDKWSETNPFYYLIWEANDNTTPAAWTAEEKATIENNAKNRKGFKQLVDAYTAYFELILKKTTDVTKYGSVEADKISKAKNAHAAFRKKMSVEDEKKKKAQQKRQEQLEAAAEKKKKKQEEAEAKENQKKLEKEKKEQSKIAKALNAKPKTADSSKSGGDMGDDDVVAFKSPKKSKPPAAPSTKKPAPPPAKAGFFKMWAQPAAAAAPAQTTTTTTSTTSAQQDLSLLDELDDGMNDGPHSRSQGMQSTSNVNINTMTSSQQTKANPRTSNNNNNNNLMVDKSHLFDLTEDDEMALRYHNERMSQTSRNMNSQTSSSARATTTTTTTTTASKQKATTSTNKFFSAFTQQPKKSLLEKHWNILPNMLMGCRAGVPWVFVANLAHLTTSQYYYQPPTKYIHNINSAPSRAILNHSTEGLTTKEVEKLRRKQDVLKKHYQNYSRDTYIATKDLYGSSPSMNQETFDEDRTELNVIEVCGDDGVSQVDPEFKKVCRILFHEKNRRRRKAQASRNKTIVDPVDNAAYTLTPPETFHEMKKKNVLSLKARNVLKYNKINQTTAATLQQDIDNTTATINLTSPSGTTPTTSANTTTTTANNTTTTTAAMQKKKTAFFDDFNTDNDDIFFNTSKPSLQQQQQQHQAPIPQHATLPEHDITEFELIRHQNRGSNNHYKNPAVYRPVKVINLRQMPWEPEGKLPPHGVQTPTPTNPYHNEKNLTTLSHIKQLAVDIDVDDDGYEPVWVGAWPLVIVSSQAALIQQHPKTFQPSAFHVGNPLEVCHNSNCIAVINRRRPTGKYKGMTYFPDIPPYKPGMIVNKTFPLDPVPAHITTVFQAAQVNNQNRAQGSDIEYIAVTDETTYEEMFDVWGTMDVRDSFLTYLQTQETFLDSLFKRSVVDAAKDSDEEESDREDEQSEASDIEEDHAAATRRKMQNQATEGSLISVPCVVIGPQHFVQLDPPAYNVLMAQQENQQDDYNLHYQQQQEQQQPHHTTSHGLSLMKSMRSLSKMSTLFKAMPQQQGKNYMDITTCPIKTTNSDFYGNVHTKATQDLNNTTTTTTTAKQQYVVSPTTGQLLYPIITYGRDQLPSQHQALCPVMWPRIAKPDAVPDEPMVPSLHLNLQQSQAFKRKRLPKKPKKAVVAEPEQQQQQQQQSIQQPQQDVAPQPDAVHVLAVKRKPKRLEAQQ